MERLIGIDKARPGSADHSAYAEMRKQPDGTWLIERVLTVPPVKTNTPK